MIRPFTIATLLLALGSGLYMYQEKHRTALLDRDITRLAHEADAVRVHTGMLRTEWASLNDQTRLDELATRYLQLKPLAPTQYVQLADLAAHLPPTRPIPPDAPPDLAPPDLAPPDPASASPARGPSATTDDDAAPAVAAAPPKPVAIKPPAVMADAQTAPPRKPPTRHAPTERAPTDRAPTDRALTDRALTDRALTAQASNAHLAPGQPLGLAAPRAGVVLSTMARATPTPRRYAPMVATVQAASAYAPSALGGSGRALPPPVPYDGR